MVGPRGMRSLAEDVASVLDVLTAKAEGLRAAGILTVKVADVEAQFAPAAFDAVAHAKNEERMIAAVHRDAFGAGDA